MPQRKTILAWEYCAFRFRIPISFPEMPPSLHSWETARQVSRHCQLLQCGNPCCHHCSRRRCTRELGTIPTSSPPSSFVLIVAPAVVVARCRIDDEKSDFMCLPIVDVVDVNTGRRETPLRPALTKKCALPPVVSPDRVPPPSRHSSSST